MSLSHSHIQHTSGLARMYGMPKTHLSPQAITLWYKPPELLLGTLEYSAAADVWSAGCIFAELLLRQPLQGNVTDTSQLNTILQVFGTPTETNWRDHNTLPCVHVVLSGTALLQFHLMKSLQLHRRIAFLCYVPCSCWIPTKDLLHLSV